MRQSRFLYSILVFFLLLSFLGIPLPSRGQDSDFIMINNGVINITFGTVKSQQGWYFGESDYLFQGNEYFAVGNCSQAVASSFPFYTTVLERFAAASGVPDTWYSCRLFMNALGFQLGIRRSIYVPSNSSHFFINYNVTNLGTAAIPAGKFFQVINYRYPIMMPLDEGGYIQTRDAVISNGTMQAWKGFKCVTANSSDHGAYLLQSDGSLVSQDIAMCRLNNEDRWVKANSTNLYLYLALATDSEMNLDPNKSLNICFNVAFAESQTNLYQLLNNKPDFAIDRSISLRRLTSSKTVSSVGLPISIDVEVENLGDVTATFEVTVYANALVVGTKIVEGMAPHSTRKVSFLWQTMGFRPQNYVISTTMVPITAGLQIIRDRLVSDEPHVLRAKGYWIVVAGDYNGDKIDMINDGCNQVYRILKQVGYRRSDIFLMHQPQYDPEDVDGDGYSDVDALSRVENLQYEIVNTAVHRVSATIPLFLYLFDHGGIDDFSINSVQSLTPSALSGWLDTLENTTNTQVCVIYAACHAGSFTNDLSKPGRIVITSCNETESSWLSYDGTWEAFSRPFWTKIKSGYNVARAFNYSCDVMGAPQTPQLDDDGNGVSHTGPVPNGGDGYLAQNLRIGLCEWPYPWISYAIAKQAFKWPPPPEGVPLWAIVENEAKLTNVTAWMQAPDWTLPTLADRTLTSMNLEGFSMSDADNDGNWTVTIPAANFTNHALGSGRFKFYVSAQEENNNTAIPQTVIVEFAPPSLMLMSTETTPPSVSVERPLEEAVVHGTLHVNGTATDDTSVDRVELYSRGNLLQTLNLNPLSTSFYDFNLDTTTFENGLLNILVKAFDVFGNSANQTMAVYVNNFVHDVAVTDITPLQTSASQGEDIRINVTAANCGSYSETFNLTVYVNMTTVASQIVTIQPGEFNTASFYWNTTGFSTGSYSLIACAWPVPDETDTTNNNQTLTETPIIIIPEFPAAFAIPTLITATLITIIVYKRKRSNLVPEASPRREIRARLRLRVRNRHQRAHEK